MARRAWSDVDVVQSLMSASSGTRDRLWIARYFASRRGPALWRRRLAPGSRRRGLRLKELAGPLHVTCDSGGLATYYEIVSQRIYAASESFAPRSGEVVVDIGANIGVFTLWASARLQGAGRVVAIEPVPIAYDQLRRNVEGVAVATALPVACGDGEGDVTLHYPPGRISVASVAPRDDRTVSVTVPLRRVATVLEELGITHVDFLKVDVEGFELEVLKGAGGLLSNVRAVAIEVDSDKAAAVEAHLAAYGLVRSATLTGMWGLEGASVLSFERGPGGAFHAPQAGRDRA